MTVPEFSDLPLIPTGNFSKIASNPGNPVDVLRSTVSARRPKSPAGPMAAVTGGEFRRESDLVVLSQAKGLDDKISQR